VARVAAVAIDGTSATTMLIDEADGSPLAEPKLYNEAQDTSVVGAVKAMAPSDHTTTAPTSALCKVLTWHSGSVLREAEARGCRPRVLHQADWAAYKLHGLADVTDFNNSLKLGYDPGAEEYPDWITSQDFAPVLPQHVVAPGENVGMGLRQRGPKRLRPGAPSACRGSWGARGCNHPHRGRTDRPPCELHGLRRNNR